MDFEFPLQSQPSTSEGRGKITAQNIQALQPTKNAILEIRSRVTDVIAQCAPNPLEKDRLLE